MQLHRLAFLQFVFNDPGAVMNSNSYYVLNIGIAIVMNFLLKRAVYFGCDHLKVEKNENLPLWIILKLTSILVSSNYCV
jgi:hypothetical protein